MIGTGFLTIAHTLPAVADAMLAVLATGAILWVERRHPALAAGIAARFRLPARTYILAAAILPVAIRLAMLPWDPAPEPYMHDDFTHLLVADTLASGRLANPPHPLWRHLETIYILQQPAYAAKYPLGQGMVLAMGQLTTGIPWAGVLLAVALMSGGIAWMLFGCLPRPWAEIGGLLGSVVYGLAPAWVDRYTSGAFCAFGGALLFGALCRLWRQPSRAMAVTAGVGWSIVWLVRPFESILLLLALWGLVAGMVYRDRKAWKRWIAPVLLLLTVLAAAGALTMAHNRAVTGQFTMLPYQYCQRIYGVPQTLRWQKPAPEPELRYPELVDVYRWQRQAKEETTAQSGAWFFFIVKSVETFYVTPWFALPVLMVPLLRKDRMVGFAAVLTGCAIAAAWLYPFFFPYYIAAYTAAILYLILRGLMRLSEWKAGGRILVRFLLCGGAAMGLLGIPMRMVQGLSPGGSLPSRRAPIADRLRREGGQHVVFVRYGAGHSFHEEWVYNAANIDASPIVWVRATDPADEAEVVRYYAGRKFWMANVAAGLVQFGAHGAGAARKTTP